MLDKLIVEGPWGMPQPHHLMRLTRVTYQRFSQSKAKQATTYMFSPLTGAQLEVQYMVKAVAGRDMGYVRITIPVASALVGHNYFHDGLAALRWEILCTGQLVRIVLYAIGMKDLEIENYMATARTIFAELTWHTLCESVNARRSLQNRTIEFIRAMRGISPRHDIMVSDAEVCDSKSGCALLVRLKSGDGTRQYCKAEQLKSGRRQVRRENSMHEGARDRLRDTLKMLEKHVRNEVLAGEDTLGKLGLGCPGLLKHPHRVLALVQAVWAKLGFGSHDTEFDRSQIGDAAMATLERFWAGEDVLTQLSTDVGSRHRKEILAANGPEIALAGVNFRFKPANLGYQLDFERRWSVPVELLDLVVSERTGPSLLEELKRGLAYTQHGELPDIKDADAAKSWRARWDKFREEQRLGVADGDLEAA